MSFCHIPIRTPPNAVSIIIEFKQALVMKGHIAQNSGEQLPVLCMSISLYCLCSVRGLMMLMLSGHETLLQQSVMCPPPASAQCAQAQARITDRCSAPPPDTVFHDTSLTAAVARGWSLARSPGPHTACSNLRGHVILSTFRLFLSLYWYLVHGTSNI